MKKLITLLLIFIICISLCACDGGSNTLAIGETATTDLWEIQVNSVDYGIKLSDVVNSADRYLPNEKGSIVSSNGHSFITISYSIKNLDRASQNIPNFKQKIKYKTSTVKPEKSAYYGEMYIPNGKFVPGTTVQQTSRSNGYGDLKELSGEETTLGRFYVDIPIEETLNDNVKIYFTIPNSKGKDKQFAYEIKPNEMNLNESK